MCTLTPLKYVPFPLLYPAPNLPDTGPVVEFYKKLRTSFRHEWLAEEPLVSTAFGWSEDSGFRATTNEYTWNPSDGWAQMETVDSDYLTLETAQWTCDDPYIRDWHLSYGNGLFLDEYLGGVPLEGNEPPSFYRPTGNIIGQWTTDQATHRIGSGEDHSEGHLITKPQPGTGYEPRSRRSEMFRMEGELLEPYTTLNGVRVHKFTFFLPWLLARGSILSWLGSHDSNIPARCIMSWPVATVVMRCL